MTSHTQAGRNEFPTTSWTLVVAAGNPLHRDCRDALARLCEHYWYPVYAYVRRRGWGLPPQRKWHFEASRFRDVAPRDPARPPDPYTLEKYLAEETGG